MVFTVLILSIPSFACAEVKTFVKEYTYQASEYDSKVTCRTLAFEQVKKLLLEELGTYVESETVVQNMRVTDDRIRILSAGIIRTEVLNERWDGNTYYLKVKLAADPDDISQKVQAILQDREKTQLLEAAQKESRLLWEELQKLKNELASQKDSKQAAQRYNETAQALAANEWLREGIGLFVDGDLKGALMALTNAINLEPKKANHYHVRGFVYSRAERYSEALADYNIAIQLEPTYGSHYNSRGMLLSQIGNFKDAIRDYDAAIKLDPTKAIYYHNRAGSYAKLGDDTKAISDYMKAVTMDSEILRTDYLQPSVGLRFENGDFVPVVLPSEKLNLEAKRLFDLFIKKYPNHPQIYITLISRGNRNGRLGKVEEAIKDYQKALELNPQFFLTYFNLGFAYSFLGKYPEAINCFTQALELSKEDKPSLYFRGELYFKIRNYKNALADTERIISTTRQDERPRLLSLAYYIRGASLLSMSRTDDAIMNFEKSIAFYPFNPFPYADLG